ncbi:MAG: MOSC domain-containing protein [Chloroflexota bacterium]
METEAAAPTRDLAPHTAVVRAAPRDHGLIASIIVRPGRDQRTVVTDGVLDPEEGLVGDDWKERGSRFMADGSSDPEAQLTIMSTRVLAAIEPDEARWPLAGDQLLADLDISDENLPVGARLRIGEAEVVVTGRPHTGCAKFAERFGHDALRWISTPEGRALRMRGLYVRVVRRGAIRVGDEITKA